MPVCLITGASSGIGEALAREYARRGWAVGLIARRKPLMDALVQELRSKGAKAAAAAADVTDRAALEAAVQALEGELGPCDLMIANAGGDPGISKRLDPEAIISTMNLNYNGVVYAMGAVLPRMQALKRGSIAVVSSIAHMRGIPRFGAYSASKAAVSALCEALRPELAAWGIRLHTINPGFVHTPLTANNKSPMPFVLNVDDAARRIANAIEAGQAVYTFPFPTRIAMAFATLLPASLWDRLMGRGFKAK
ncbi:MAG TPA: SDR family NAD(P)-dependent oxidoreductase [Myxococcota bacterium]|nr:SDR family NAD(P)-dependent oxidoreductase [Myxococcota bacterium]